MDNAYIDRESEIAASSLAGGGCIPIPFLLFSIVLVVCVLLASAAMNISYAYGASLKVAAHNKSYRVRLAPFFTSQVKYWEDEIVKWASEWNLDANLIATIIQIESCGDPLALSYAGARGLFQVMPFHFEDDEDPYDTQTNAYRGLGYLSMSLEAANGSVPLALLGYNAGISTISKPRSSWPSQGNRYIYWGANIYNDASRGFDESPVLNEWLQKGGQTLCNQAEERLSIHR